MLTNEVYIKDNGRHIIYDQQFPFKQDYLDRSKLSSAECSEGGRCPANFFDIAGKEYLIKHYYRGGFPARWFDDNYLYTGHRRVRAVREWYLLHQLHHWHLPVPRPFATTYLRSGLFYTADLIVESCRPARPLSAWLSEAPLDQKLWALIGRTLRRFHDKNVYHADLNAHNILLLPDQGKVFLVDFDRGAIRQRGRWQTANLERLLYSCRKLKSIQTPFYYLDKDFAELLSAYYTS